MRTLALVPLLLAGCAPLPPSTAPVPPPSVRCDAAAAQPLVGQAGTTATAEQALRLSGARALRWIRPGMAVTMDYREDRLNIELDEQGRIANIRCG